MMNNFWNMDRSLVRDKGKRLFYFPSMGHGLIVFGSSSWLCFCHNNCRGKDAVEDNIILLTLMFLSTKKLVHVRI
jgi:hypothetical protein